MRAHDTQKWLVYGLLLPLTLLNVAWWIMQMFVYCECQPSCHTAANCTTVEDTAVDTLAELFDPVLDSVRDVGRINPVPFWYSGNADRTIVIFVFARWLPAGLCLLWAVAILFWILLL